MFVIKLTSIDQGWGTKFYWDFFAGVATKDKSNATQFKAEYDARTSLVHIPSWVKTVYRLDVEKVVTREKVKV